MTPFLFVATPMYGGLCHGSFAAGLLRMPNVFSNNEMRFTFQYMMNESLITRARDSLAHDFLNVEMPDGTKCTHLMFIDSDIGFDPADIVKMVRADKDIICGLYPKKEINWIAAAEAAKAGVPPDRLHNYTGAFVVNAIDPMARELSGKIGEPMEISNAGTGFMLIKREVFEKLAPLVPEYNSDMKMIIEDAPRQKVVKQFFATSIDPTAGNRLLSEDYHFCKIARDAGFKVWAAPWARLSHTGTYEFTGYLLT